MAARTLTPVQLAERIVMVLKPIEDLEPGAQKEVLEATLVMMAAEKKG